MIEIQNKIGGKVIASGGFGCIFQPALKCKTRKNNTNDKRRISTVSYTHLTLPTICSV